MIRISGKKKRAYWRAFLLVAVRFIGSYKQPQSQYNEAIESYAIEQIGQRRRDEYQDGEVRAQLNVKPPSSYT